MEMSKTNNVFVRQPKKQDNLSNTLNSMEVLVTNGPDAGNKTGSNGVWWWILVMIDVASDKRDVLVVNIGDNESCGGEY